MSEGVAAAGRLVRLLFVDEGAYHSETLDLPLDGLESYDRLIDYLSEDPAVLARLHLDADRLCAAYLVENGAERTLPEG